MNPARRHPPAHRLLKVAVAALLVCAGGCDLGSGPPPSPDSLEAVAGDDQSATVGTPVPVPPAVRVLNRKGKPMAGREVIFSVASGGGRISFNARITDKEGIAGVGSWTLGTTAGPQALQAQVPELPPLILMATGVAAEPATVGPDRGGGQTGVVGSALEIPPSILVKDVYGNPVGNAAVAFHVTAGGGFVAEDAAVTDPLGVATSGAWTLGTKPGPNTLSASVQGLPAVEFSAAATPDLPSRVTVLVGDGQRGRVGTDLPLLPTLLVVDRFGNPLEGVPVTFEVTAGGGMIANPIQVTGPSGVAVAGPWTLGTQAGLQSVQVKAATLDPSTLMAFADPGPPASALAQGGDGQTATVAMAVAEPPGIRVEDAYGNPVPGVGVTFSLSGSPDPDSSPGAIDGREAMTDSAGVAAAERWTLGTIAGSYEVRAKVAGLSEALAFIATATPDLPSAVAIHEGNNQTALFKTMVSVPPSVRVEDQYGNRVARITVVFAVVEGGGTLAGEEGLSDGEGVASLGSWTLGPTPGRNRVSATVEGIGSVTFEAMGLAAPPAAISRVAGNGQSARVGTPVPTPPQVRVTDAAGNPVSGVPVGFSVASGGGSITEGEAVTDSEGLTSVGSWTLGTVAGSNTLSVSVSGLPSALFQASGLAGPPASMSSRGGDGQTALVNTAVPSPPSVQVKDSFGNPTPNVEVAFAVTGGGGTVTGSPGTTDVNGVARVSSWILGPTPGLNWLTARVAGAPDVVFRAVGAATGGFQIDLEYLTGVDAAQLAVFESAAGRWEGIIVGDIPDYGGTLPEGGCQPVLEEGGIDDVKVYVTVKAIDGSGGVLGRAGPCYYRTTGGIFPLTGIMELDEADLADLEVSGLLEDVIIHEMGHILGFGTLWNASTNDFLVGGGTVDPYFNGAAAIAAFDAAGGGVRTGPKVPVENTGGPGTRDGHWRESVHNSELMTGWIEGDGAANPLSAITIASLADMGYGVNMSAADPYLLFDPLGVPPQEVLGTRIYIQELPPPTPIPAGPGGTGPLP